MGGSVQNRYYKRVQSLFWQRKTMQLTLATVFFLDRYISLLARLNSVFTKRHMIMEWLKSKNSQWIIYLEAGFLESIRRLVSRSIKTSNTKKCFNPTNGTGTIIMWVDPKILQLSLTHVEVGSLNTLRGSD